MTATLRSLLSLFLSGFIVMLGNGLINILLPSRLNLENVSTDNIGLIMSMFSVGLLIGGIYTRRLIIRVGHIRVYTACAAMAAISILICYLWVNEWLWAVMRILMGFCIASTNIVSDGWLSERATSDTRARILATNQIVLLSAMFIGSFMINLADISNATLYVLSGLLLCGAVVPIALTSASTPDIDDVPPMPLLKLFLTSPVGIIAVLVCGMILSSLLSMIPIYAEAKGITGFNVSLLVGAAIIGGVLLQYPIGYFADRYERRKVILNIALISMILTVLVPFSIDLGFFICALALISISGGIIASLYPLGIAETFDRLQQSEMGSAIGAMIIIYACGGIIGPYAVGLAMEHTGVNSFFFFMASLQLLFALFIVYRSRVRQSIPTDQQETFVPQGAAGWVSTELDPRTEYVDTPTLSAEAQTVVNIAHISPTLALDIVSLIAKAFPNKTTEVAGALASIDGIDTTELYNRLHQTTPENQQALVKTIISESPEHSTELVSTVLDEAESDEIAELAVAMTEAAPDHSLEIIEAATEAIMDEEPEIVVDIAETYINNIADNWEEMRYADREADDGEQIITDMVSMIAEKAPDQVEEIAMAAAAIIPETDNVISEDTSDNQGTSEPQRSPE